MANLRYVDVTTTFRTASGRRLSAGTIAIFQTGSFIPATGYATASGTGASTEFTLDTYGKTTIYLPEGYLYRLVLSTSDQIVLAITDDVNGNNTTITYALSNGVLPLSSLATGTANRALAYNNSGVPSYASVSTNLATTNNKLTYTQTLPAKGYALLGKLTNSGNATYSIGPSYITSEYSTYEIEIFDLSFVTGNSDIYLRTSINGGASYADQAGDYYQQSCAAVGGTAGASDSIGVTNPMYYSLLQNGYYLNYNMSAAPGGSAVTLSSATASELNYFKILVHNPTSTTSPTIFSTVFGSYGQYSTNKPVMLLKGCGGRSGISADTTIQIASSSVWSGTIFIHGIE